MQAFNRAVDAKVAAYHNAMTPPERAEYEELKKQYAWTPNPKTEARVTATPEYVATQRVVDERMREMQNVDRERDAAYRRWRAAIERAEAAQTEVDKATQAARLASDKAYTSMVASRQHALNASRNCSHLAGIEQPQSSPGSVFGPLMPGIGIGIGSGGFGGRRGGGGRPSGEGHK
jgi:hypothetical protein